MAITVSRSFGGYGYQFFNSLEATCIDLVAKSLGGYGLQSQKHLVPKLLGGYRYQLINY